MNYAIETLTMALKTGVEVGLWIKERRKAKGYTLDTVVDRMGGACSKSFLNQLEVNKYPQKDGSPMQPAPEIVDALADALSVSRNEMRDNFGYPPVTDELTHDEVLEEFTHAVSRYKRLGSRERVFFRLHANQLLDFLIEVGTDTNKGKTRAGRDRESGASRPAVRLATGDKMPEINLDEVKHRQKSGAKKKT